jgi:hypothetical protein
MTMARTSKKPTPPTVVSSSDGTDVVLTLAEAAGYLRLAEGDVIELRSQGLPARHAGSEWRFLRSAIQDWLRWGPPKVNHEAWTRLAGVWKEDPCLEEMLKEIDKLRAERTC